MRQGHVRKLVGIVMGVLLIGLGSVAWADGPRGGGCRDGRASMWGATIHGSHRLGSTAHLLRHLLRDKEEVGLTDDQVAKLRAIALDSDRATIRAEAEVKVADRELRALMWNEQAELAGIEAKVKEREAFEATARIIGIKAKRELMGVLTPEQRAKYKALREQRRHGHRGFTQRAESSVSRDAEELADEASAELGFSVAGFGTSAG